MKPIYHYAVEEEKKKQYKKEMEEQRRTLALRYFNELASYDEQDLERMQAEIEDLKADIASGQHSPRGIERRKESLEILEKGYVLVLKIRAGLVTIDDIIWGEE